MSNIIQYIKQLYYKLINKKIEKLPPENVEIKPEVYPGEIDIERNEFMDNHLGYVTVALDKQGHLDLYFDWMKNDKATAKLYGDLLYTMNGGFLSNSILNALNDIIKEKPESTKFVHAAINKWESNLMKQYKEEEASKIEQNNDPVVPPSQFFNLRGPNSK